MSPLLFYALIAGGFGWSIHKKKWGLVAFTGALLVWILTMQIVIAMMSHSQLFSS